MSGTTSRKKQVTQPRPARRPRLSRMPKQRRGGRLLSLSGGAVAIALVIGAFLWYGRGAPTTSTAVAASSSLGALTPNVPSGTPGSFSLPLQVYALRLSLAKPRQTGGTLLGLPFGGISMSCCAPVLLPPVLSLAGFSGTAILSTNLTVHRYFVPLALLGGLLLGYSLLSTAASLGRTCAVSPAPGGE